MLTGKLNKDCAALYSEVKVKQSIHKYSPQYLLRTLFCCTGDRFSCREHNRTSNIKQVNNIPEEQEKQKSANLFACLTYCTMMETFWSK